MSASPPTIFSVRRDLRERRRALGPRVADVEEGGGRVRVLAVVGEAVAGDLDERQHLQDRRVLHDRLDHALQDDVVRELRGFGECECHDVLLSSWFVVGSSSLEACAVEIARQFSLEGSRTGLTTCPSGVHSALFVRFVRKDSFCTFDYPERCARPMRIFCSGDSEL